MSRNQIKGVVAAVAVGALAAAPGALADPPTGVGNSGQGSGNQGHGKPADPGSQGKGKAGTKTVMYVFKGTYAGTNGVNVTKGNNHVKKANLVGTLVTFDLASAAIVVDDVNGDGARNLTDVATGDKVVVKARLPRKEPGTQPFAAKQLVDQTHSSGGGTTTPTP